MWIQHTRAPCDEGPITTSHQVVLARRCKPLLDMWPKDRLEVSVRVSAPLMLSPLLLMDVVFLICVLGQALLTSVRLLGRSLAFAALCSHQGREGIDKDSQ